MFLRNLLNVFVTGGSKAADTKSCNGGITREVYAFCMLQKKFGRRSVTGVVILDNEAGSPRFKKCYFHQTLCHVI